MVGICILVITMVATVDLGIKWYIEHQFQNRHRIKNSKLEIRRVHNEGLMLDLLDHKPRVVSSLSFLALLLVLGYQMFLFRKPGHKAEKIGTALIAGGAVSNTFDRISRGYVVDYFGFRCKWKKLARITYNIGDFAIFTGLFLMACAKRTTTE